MNKVNDTILFVFHKQITLKKLERIIRNHDLRLGLILHILKLLMRLFEDTKMISL